MKQADELRHSKRLKTLEDLPYSFNLDRLKQYAEEADWHTDNYSIELPSESPGAPLIDGSFERANAILLAYKFPVSDLITGIYGSAVSLHKRVMLLRARFLIFTFWFGVRLTRVIDETVTIEGQSAYRWGYAYATLEGHFEHGEISFVVVKQAQTGKVLLRIQAVSQPGDIKNPFYRFGFKLFGRSLQKRFAHDSLRRIKTMVEANSKCQKV